MVGREALPPAVMTALPLKVASLVSRFRGVYRCSGRGSLRKVMVRYLECHISMNEWIHQNVKIFRHDWSSDRFRTRRNKK